MEQVAPMVDPAITSRFWFTRGSGRLEPGKQITGEWEMHGVSAQVSVKTVERNKLEHGIRLNLVADHFPKGLEGGSLPLAAKYGGVHHGAFLPHEGPNNIAVHLFSFPSLAEYERYRTAVRDDEVAKAAWRLAEETRCIVSFERSFMRPVFANDR